jgi:outer membrane protein
MKKILYIYILTLAISIVPAYAQMKVGYFDLEYVMPLMPEVKKAETDLEAYAKQLDNEFVKKQKEFETKYKDFLDMAKNPDASQTILASKQEELQTLQKQLQEFEQKSVSDIQTRRDKALAPVYEKIETTVTEVAKANAYSHIMRIESCYLPIKDQNISDLVLKKLGITPPPPPEKK